MTEDASCMLEPAGRSETIRSDPEYYRFPLPAFAAVPDLLAADCSLSDQL